MIRRMVHLNVRTLYKRSCDLCNKENISIYPEQTSFPVYCPRCWWSDAWDPMDYGREFDPERPFLEQYKEILKAFPVMSPSVMYTSMINSDYTNVASELKNCYLLFNSDYDEDCAYGTYVERSKNAYDTYMVDQLEHCYECINVRKSFKTFYSIDCENCVDVWFSRNLSGCSNCFGCINLRGKSYCIFNEQYDKDEYEVKIKELFDGSQTGLVRVKEKVRQFHLTFPRRFMTGIKNANVTGEYISESKNVFQSYEVVGGEEVKYSQFVFIPSSKDIQDVTMWGGNIKGAYNCMGIGDNQSQMGSCLNCWAACHDIAYSKEILTSCSHIFGSVGLRNKNYCILNKQYSKEDYFALVSVIKERMKQNPYVDRSGVAHDFGDFFPPEFSHFSYNETVAHDQYPLTKEEALKQGFVWRDEEKRTYTATVPIGLIPEHVQSVPESFVNEIIECSSKGDALAKCSTAFRLIPSELAFYKMHNLPLPSKCSNCRHSERLKMRNSMKLHIRQCECDHTSHGHLGRCSTNFETSFAPEQEEIVYCEKCYQSEIL